jgi:aspartate aminotransferase
MKISQHALSIGASPTLALNEKAKILRVQGKPVINLGVGEPKNPTPEGAIEFANSRLLTHQIKYTPSSGSANLKNAIVQYTTENYQRTPSEENILVTVGAKQAIYNSLLAIIDPGDEVILLAPYWVSYPEMVKLSFGIPIIVEPTQGWLSPTSDEVLTAVTNKTRAIILNSPNNPSGLVYSPDFVAEIVRFCENREIYLIMDDIYHKLVFGLTPWVPGYTFSNKKIDSSFIVVINGVSKTYGMTGFRIGWAVGSSELIRIMTNIQSQTTSGASIVMMDAALGALSGPQDVVAELLATIKKNRDVTMDGLRRIEKVTVNNPDGTFYCFPDFHAYNIDSMILSEYLLEEALVALVPGIAFGLEGYLRISFAGDYDEISEALTRIEGALNKL